ncbi:MAG: DNA polymerase III subunit delta [Anaerolineales bacterium]|nr:DNA polymerase III subunit delta [Anaerolineales bacterium]
MFYLFHGDDDHSKKEFLDKQLSKLGDPSLLDLNTTRFAGIMPFADLRQACDALPFLAPARVVLVTDLFAAKPNKSFMDALLTYLPVLPKKTRLVFLESQALRSNHAVVKMATAENGGYAKLFERPQGSGVERWIQIRVGEENGRISPDAAHLLATNVGNDLQILDNEIEKLLLYKGVDAGIIESEDVTLLSPYAAEASIFDLVDALGNRNAKRAAILLQQKIADGTDPFYLFTMFVRQFRLLIQVKELADVGLHPPAIAKEIKQHRYVVGKLFQQARGFSMSQLEQIYRHLLDIDVGVKTGQADMLTSLNLLIANLTVAN